MPKQEGKLRRQRIAMHGLEAMPRGSLLIYLSLHLSSWRSQNPKEHSNWPKRSEYLCTMIWES
jgi:hypothetical protein